MPLDGRPTTSAKPIEDIYPLSPLQKSFLFHSQLRPASTAYLVQLFWTIEGPLDEAAFRRAWDLSHGRSRPAAFRRHRKQVSGAVPRRKTG